MENKVNNAVWEKVIQRNLPPLAWTGIAHNDTGIQIGKMKWERGSEIVAKYKTEHFFVVQNANQFYKTNIKEYIKNINREFENSIDKENNEIKNITQCVPGSSKQYLKILNTKHSKAEGLMVMAFDLANDVREKIDAVIKNKNNDFEEYLAMPWEPTAIQREQVALEDIRQQILDNPGLKDKFLEKMEVNFGYIHQDYLGQPWKKDDYEKALSDGVVLCSGMLEDFSMSEFSDYEKWLISIFKKINYMYEEGRNAMVRCVWAMKETVKSMGHNPEYMLQMTTREIDNFCDNKQNVITKELVKERKKAFALYFNNGIYTEYSGKQDVENLLKQENIFHFWDMEKTSVKELKGSIAYKGYAKGRARIVFTQEDSNKLEEGEILITPMTQVEFLSGIRKCAAIVTDEGGIICHAAIVAREFGRPCILATKNATQVIKNGDIIEVDAERGVVKIVKQ